MHERAALAALLCVAVLTGPAVAGESLDVLPPEGFSGVHVSDAGGVRLTGYVLDGEGLDDWSKAVTVAEIAGSGLSAEAQVSADKAAGCAQALDLDPEVTDDAGRVSTMSIHACPNYDASGRPEVVLLRVIEGNGRLHAVQRAWVTSPPRAVLDAWTERLRAIRLCDGSGCR